MSRKIDVDDELIYRSDAPTMHWTGIEVVHSENTRMYEPDVSDLVADFMDPQIGQIEAVTVRPLGRGRCKVQLAIGYRRYLAAKKVAEFQESQGVPIGKQFKLRCNVEVINSTVALDRNIIENAKRRDLSPIEAAHTIQRWRNVHGQPGEEGTKQLAKLFCREPGWVSETEDLLSLSEEQQHQVHIFWESKGKSGLSKGAALRLLDVPEAERQEALEKAQAAASIRGRSNTARGRSETDTNGAGANNVNTNAAGTLEESKEPNDAQTATKPTKVGRSARVGGTAVTARQMANAATKATGDKSNLPNRTVKDLKEFIDGYFDGSEQIRPLHAQTAKLLSRLSEFMVRKVNETSLDNAIIAIDGCLHLFWEKYEERKKAGK